MSRATSAPDPLRVLHLVGSATSEELADVSRLYARGALAALDDPERYEHHVAHVDPGGAWRFPTGLSRPALALAAPRTIGESVRRIEALAPDVVVPQMFCVPGMTTYRALLEAVGLPYLGNRPATMAIGADKALTRAVLTGAGVPVAAGATVAPGEACPLDGPVVVKPVDADNSVGVHLVRETAGPGGAAAFAAAVTDAVAGAVAGGGSGRALVEAYVPLGREVRCGVLEVDGELVCLPLEEYAVDEATKPVRLADDKLRRDPDGELALVAKDAAHAWIVPDDDPVVPAVHAAARAAYRALGCRHYGLFDLRVDPAGRPYVLEAGLYCSYAPTSVLVVMARAAGIDLETLFRTAVHDVLPERAPSRPFATRRVLRRVPQPAR